MNATEKRQSRRGKAIVPAGERLRVRTRVRTRRRRSLAAQFRAGQAEERRYLSHELGDRFGRLLTEFSFHLKALKESASSPRIAEACPAAFAQLDGLVEDMGQELHRLMAGLRSDKRASVDLAHALETYVPFWGRQAGIAATFTITGEVGIRDMARLALAVENNVFRIVQEALANVAKHAIPGGATQAAVTMQECSDHLIVIVRDNGPGFAWQLALHAGRVGLLGMGERVDVVGGAMAIESSAAEGTTIVLRIPLGASFGTRVFRQP